MQIIGVTDCKYVRPGTSYQLVSYLFLSQVLIQFAGRQRSVYSYIIGTESHHVRLATSQFNLAEYVGREFA